MKHKQISASPGELAYSCDNPPRPVSTHENSPSEGVYLSTSLSPHCPGCSSLFRLIKQFTFGVCLRPLAKERSVEGSLSLQVRVPSQPVALTLFNLSYPSPLRRANTRIRGIRRLFTKNQKADLVNSSRFNIYSPLCRFMHLSAFTKKKM